MMGRHVLFGGAVALICCGLAGEIRAQDATPEEDLIQRGVVHVIPADVDPEETVTGPVPLVEVLTDVKDLDWSPNFLAQSETLKSMAQQAYLRRPVWTVEFAFKTVRMIEVDVPQPSGKMQRKLIWYLLYRVRNNGYDLNPEPRTDEFGHTLYDPQDVNFRTRPLLGKFVVFPHFVLHSQEFNKEYLDRVIPAAQRAIQQREDPNHELGEKIYNSIEITRVPIPLSDDRVKHSIWGVATWEDVDPRIDFFSVFVRGLSNSYQFEDPEGAYQPGAEPGSGRILRFKTLQLNFWRPGDTVLEHEREIRFGVPIDPDPALQQQILAKYGLSERLDHLWVYR